MKVFDIIDNENFNAEFPYVVRTTDEYGNPVKEFVSWEDEIPIDILNEEVVFLNVVNGYGYMPNMAVMVIDVYDKY